MCICMYIYIYMCREIERERERERLYITPLCGLVPVAAKRAPRGVCAENLETRSQFQSVQFPTAPSKRGSHSWLETRVRWPSNTDECLEHRSLRFELLETGCRDRVDRRRTGNVERLGRVEAQSSIGEMGGAPRNPATRNHFSVQIVKPPGRRCTDGHLTSRVLTED